MTADTTWTPPLPPFPHRAPASAAAAWIALGFLALVTIWLALAIPGAEALPCEADFCPSDVTFENVVAEAPGMFAFGVACNVIGLLTGVLLLGRQHARAARNIAIALIGVTFFCCTAALVLEQAGRAMTASM